MSYVNLNGRILKEAEAHFPVAAWSLRFGYGLFETMLVQDGRIRLAHYHWERLTRSMETLGWSFPPHFGSSDLEEAVLRTVAHNNMQAACRVRLQLFTGRSGLFDQEPHTSQFLVECMEVQPAALVWNENGLMLGISNSVRKSTDMLANLKTTNTLLYTLAADEAKRHKWNDALILNSHERLAESTIANLFIINGKQVITPPLSEGCIAGTLRRFLIENIPGIRESPITSQDLASASEVFLVNAVRGIKWVGEISGVRYQNRLTKEIYESLFFNKM